jgi:sulfatase maturation enzyme AslB (radical SAM superfamily)
MKGYECKTWDYLRELGVEHERYCPYALVCNGLCYFANEIEQPEKALVPEDTGMNRFFARLKKTAEIINSK